MELRVDMKRIKEIIEADARRRLVEYVRCSDTCDLCDTEHQFIRNPPITLFQAQLIKAGACVEGRARVGEMTAREWWNTSTEASDMRWVLKTMCGVRMFPQSFYYYWTDASCNNIRAAYPFEKVRELSGKLK